MDVDGSCQFDRFPAQSILAITSDELLKIFSLLPEHERCRVIPTLCKSFASALRQSGDLYQLLDLDLTEMDTIITNPADKACTEMFLADMLCWLMPRAPFVRNLRVHLMEGWEALAKDTMTSALSACCALQRLDLSVVGRLNLWLPAIFSLTNLKELYLAANSTWARLPPALGNLSSLEVLHIKMAIDGGRNMAEKFVPLEMLGCTSLRQLSFFGCKGLVVSPVIGELMSLQSLTVHGTNMRPGRDAIHPCAFQRGSFATTCLTSLQLTDCNFDAIPFQICHLHSLKRLNLSQNHLRKLPKLLAAYLRDLAVLDLSRNCFRCIPPVLASLHNLRYLNLAENADLEVCGESERASLGYIGREEAADEGVALTYIVCSLAELEVLDVRKRPDPDSAQQAVAPMPDPWKPACRATLTDVATAVRVRSRWCNLQHFLYDEAPRPTQAPVH
ncbi:probable leucine-rich repeat-containing protein 7 [Coccomyxa sp. Obi]|nr:probable leucine-rich repeat-containing protein 7 [Coccomyxa sp. Obi]